VLPDGVALVTVTPSTRDPRQRTDGASLIAYEVAGLSAVRASEWDSLLAPGSAALSHAYLAAWERVELAGLRSAPVLARRPDGVLAAACPGYSYRLDLVGVRLPAAARVLGVARRAWPAFLCALTYELGTPAPLTRPFLIADEAQRASVVRALVTAAIQAGERGGARFLVVQNFTSREGPAAEQLRRLGFAVVPIFPTAVVDLPFGSFDDYLGAMRAQYRRRARQTMRRSAELRVERLTDFEGVADDLARLWRLVFERAREVRREILTPEYFRAISRLESSSVILTRRPDHSIASFALLLADHPWLSFLQCGFDREAGRSEGAYFRLLYEIVRAGIEGGYQQVELGITTLAPKLDVGGVPVPLFAWVKHRNPVIQRAMRAWANGPMRPTQLEPRHVFKEPPRSPAELVAQRGLPG
jgi:predicted N-acyltransferase